MNAFFALLAIIFGWAPVPHAWTHLPGVTRIKIRVTVYVAPGIDRTPIDRAVAELNAAAGTAWTVTVGTGGVYRGTVQIGFGDTTACHGDQGCTTERVDGGMVVWAQINVRPGTATWWVYFHELGHAAGAGHVDTADVMRPGDGNAYVDYQAGDIAGFRALERT